MYTIRESCRSGIDSFDGVLRFLEKGNIVFICLLCV